MNWLLNWADNDARSASSDASEAGAGNIDWKRVWPFFFLHAACFTVLWVGWSTVAIAVAIGAYLVRMFAITAFFHRYFSHKSFKTSRAVQFFFALIGTASTQRGPLWWAAHHRHHHRFADKDEDLHSPNHGFFQSHCGWFLNQKNFKTQDHLIKDFARFPELQWLDRYDTLVALGMAVLMWCLGEAIAWLYPGLGTSGWQMLIWGYFISTVALIHATLAINSFAHRFGSRRYQTKDLSRNSLLLALITLGEGWHNNHHHYAGAARQGFFWWEIDISFYLLKVMEKFGLVWDLRPVPYHKRWAHKGVARQPGGGHVIDGLSLESEEQRPKLRLQRKQSSNIKVVDWSPEEAASSNKTSRPKGVVN